MIAAIFYTLPFSKITDYFIKEEVETFQFLKFKKFK